MQRALLCLTLVIAISACSGGGGANSGPAAVLPSQSSNSSATTLPKHYSLVDLGAFVRPAAVNTSNTVVGERFINGTGNPLAFRYKNGQLVTLRSDAVATDINDSGVAVGTDVTGGLAFKPDGSIVSLGTVPNTYPSGLTINNSGEIAGISFVAGIAACAGTLTFFSLTGPPNATNVTAIEAVLNNSGTVVVAQYPQFDPGCPDPIVPVYYPSLSNVPLPANLSMNPNNAAITDINDAGDVIGYSTASNAPLASFYVHNGSPTEITPPSGNNEIGANGINNRAWIVGFMENSAQSHPVSHAFVWIAGTTTDLNTLLPAGCAGWTLNSAADVNDGGVIVGTGTLKGTAHGFMLLPAP